jgi:hypothetical protein
VNGRGCVVFFVGYHRATHATLFHYWGNCFVLFEKFCTGVLSVASDHHVEFATTHYIAVSRINRMRRPLQFEGCAVCGRAQTFVAMKL